jgi:hypothetical protein
MSTTSRRILPVSQLQFEGQPDVSLKVSIRTRCRLVAQGAWTRRR